MNRVLEQAKSMFESVYADDFTFYDPSKYKWFIGYQILDELKAEALGGIEYITLYNIEISIDADNPRRFELWKKVAEV